MPNHQDELEPLLPKHGGYRNLRSFQVARLAYDVTFRFCRRYIERGDRTRDQMVQAARSGVQNIAEGSAASGTSRKMEIKLTNVAKASLEELKLDYEDYLRQRGHEAWPEGDARRTELIARRPQTVEDVVEWVHEVRQRGHSGPSGPQPGSASSTESTRSTKSTPPPHGAIAANAALTLTSVAISLLKRQVDSQAHAFENEGGFTERLYRTRMARRDGP